MKKLAKIALVGSLSCFMALPVLADLNDGLVAYYPFDGNTNDFSGYENHGTENGGVSYSTGIHGQAIKLDGVNNYITIADSVSISPTKAITLSAWVKPDFISDSLGFRIISKCLSVNDCGKNSYILGFYYMQVLNTPFYISARARVSEWSHIVGTFDGNYMKLYKNGNLIDSQYVSGNIFDSSAPLTIGANGHFSENYAGFIDDARIYNRALSEEEVKELYEGTPIGDCEHATYSFKKRTLTVPFIEIPIIDFLTGQSNGEVELWTSNLRQVSGTSNRFKIISKTLAPITDGSSTSCPATYAIETGTLSIPYVDIPVGIGIGNKKSEIDVDIFKATMTWVPMGRSFVIQEIEKLE